MVTEDIEKAAQDSIGISNDNDWLTGDLARYVLSRLLNLIYTADTLPRAGNHGLLFEIIEIFVGVPGSGNSECPLKWRVGIVAIDDAFEGFPHWNTNPQITRISQRG